ncbi:neuronal acetylcholine receptor subunit alpha-7-like [Apostichopus japonicus]|uniref:neuronal acetylcholine receptor subunit alpha-7-like n=1 Tax=Stichopus japonicus TaxID=307972 RepID=UPI003AB7AEB8
MERSIITLLLVTLSLTISEATLNKSTDISAHKGLVDELLLNYGPRSVRPRIRHDNRVEVSFYFKPFILSSFDEQKQQLSIEGTIYMGWVDEFLQWEPEDYDGVDIVSLRNEDLWMPDVTTYERLEIGSAEVNVFQPYVIANSSGHVTFYQQSLITVYCRLNMSKFPFDVQVCLIKFASYSYGSDQVYLKYANTSASNDNDFNLNGVWMLETFHVREVEITYKCCPTPYVEIHYELVLARIGNFYVFSIWVPCGLLSILELTVFLMHPNSGEKVSLSVTNVLAFILFQQIVIESMPRSGDDSPIIVAYFSAMIGISCASVLASAIVLRVYHHDPTTPVPRFLRCLLFHRPVLTGMPTVATKNSTSNEYTESILPPTSVGVKGQLINSGPALSAAGQKHNEDVGLVGSGAPIHRKLSNGHLQYKATAGKANEKNMADWMKLALMLDKLCLMVAVFAMLGTLLYCLIRFAM